MEEEEDIENKFNQAILFINNAKYLNNILSSEQKLTFYAFYKQATIGPCLISKPWFDIMGRAKWDAWKKLGDKITKLESMKLYIKELEKIEPNWKNKWKEQEKNLLEEKKNNNQKSLLGGPVFSKLIVEDEKEKLKNEKDICYYSCKGDIQKVLNLIETEKININWKDIEGRAAIHYACDRGNIELLKELIKYGANINLQDKEGQTPIHYAIMIENYEIISLLLQLGVDISIRDEEGNSPIDIANEEIKKIIQNYKIIK